MTELKTVELWIAMDSDGDHETGCDEETAITNYNDNIGGCLPLRVVKINIAMRPPVVTEASVTVPDEIGQTVLADTEQR